MKIALVTGANRGIGKEITRQLAAEGMEVYAVGRDLQKVIEAIKGLPGKIIPLECDITVTGQCRQLFADLSKHCKQLDVLVNNAGVMGNTKATDFDMVEMHRVMEVNVYGAMNVTAALWPLLEKSSDARIINISSGMAEVVDMSVGGFAPYRLSKWTLNGWTKLMAADAPKNIRINSICPGWVKTDMGGASAPRSVDKGAETAVWLATEAEIPNGKFMRDKKEIAQ